MAIFRDPAAGFDNVLIRMLLHLQQSLATTQNCNSLFSLLPSRSAKGYLEVLGILALLAFGDSVCDQGFYSNIIQ